MPFETKMQLAWKSATVVVRLPARHYLPSSYRQWNLILWRGEGPVEFP
jgi:hypothetical protein